MWPATRGQKSQDATFYQNVPLKPCVLGAPHHVKLFWKKMFKFILGGKKCPTQAHGHCKGSQSVHVYQQMEVKLQLHCLHAIQRVNVNAWVGDEYINRKKKETKLFLLSCNYASSELNIHKDFCNSSRCQRPKSLRTAICPAGPFEIKLCSD